MINEIMSSNASAVADEDGDYPDWLELYNPGPQPVNLAGYALSDENKNPLKWRFETGTVEAGGFLLVFASGKDRQPAAALVEDMTTLPGLKLWLRADSINPTNTAEVRQSNGRYFLQRWLDQSGQARHAAQPSLNQQPEWLAGSPATAGLPWLRFDGTDDSLSVGSVFAQNDFCVIAVARATAGQEIDPESASGVGGVAGERYLFGAAHGGDNNGGAGLSVGSNGISAYEHGSGYMPALAVYKGPVGPGLAVISLNYAGRRPAIYLQGTLARTGLSSPRAAVLAPVQIGAGPYGAFRGELAELLVYGRSLPDGERRAVEEYLARKYGLKLLQRFHTSFALNASGENLFLANPQGEVVDRLLPGPLPRDISFGRKPDGQGELFFFAQSTPGGPNSTAAARELLEAPAFSQSGGFYSNSFSLSLAVTNDGAVIRYTLDGSEPSEKSSLYTNTITLTSRAGSPNIFSAVPTAPGWQAPAGEVFKGTVVRARSFKAGALPSAIVTETYWVTARGRARYSVPVVSLSTDRANFFDPAIGIYVAGNASGGNYSQRGPNWERPVHVEFFETNGARVFAGEGGVKIHGNTSQNFPVKGLDLDAGGGRGTGRFRHAIFPGRPRAAFRHLLLRPAGHDYSMAFMRDPMMQSLVEGLGVETQASRLAVVFLNGEYWGLHYLQEKEDADFIETYGRVAEGEYDYLEGYASAREGDTRQYEAFQAFLAGHDLSNPAYYAQVETMMDVANYTIYKATEIFNYRWDIGNHRLWRTRAEGARWRWIHFDDDVGWGGFWAEQPAWSFDMLEAVTQPTGSLHDHNNETTTFLLRKLLASADFKRTFINGFADLLNTAFHSTRTTARVNQMAAALEPEMQEHINRWRAPASLSAWKSNVQYLRDFANRRPAAVRQHIVKKFGLRGTALVRVSLADPNMGSLTINTLDLLIPGGTSWDGVYFKDVPITIRAVPRRGYRFAGWTGSPGLTSNPLVLSLRGDLTLSPAFALDPAARPVLTGAEPLGDYIRITGQGLPELTYELQVSTNFLEWRSHQETFSGTDGALDIFTSPPGSAAASFYRLALP